jgi:methionyl-tRNA formyltransferase
MSSRSLLFLGSKEAGLRALRRLLFQLPSGCLKAILCPDDRSDSRCELTEFESLARLHGIPIHVVSGSAETAQLIHHYDPSTAIVHGWYKLISVSDFPGTSFYGFHYSPLPRYRGNAPLVWQIINGESRLAVSFFVLSTGLDDGDLLDQRYFDLSTDEGIGDALVKANAVVEEIIDDFVPHWVAGDVRLFRQPDEPASYCGLRLPDDGRINWWQSAPTVQNFIRAQARPYPGAFSILTDGRKVTLWKTTLENRIFFGQPGAVVEVGPSEVVVACGSGALRVLRIQLSDGPEQEPRLILNSLKMRLT